MPRLLCLVGWLLLVHSAFPATQTILYVSPNGSGTNFSQGQPGNLFAARDLARTLATNMTGDIVVNLAGGIYQFTNSLQLQENTTNHDSGTGGFNVIYQGGGATGNQPIISGGLLATNWTLFSASSNIWRTFVGTGVNSRQLYVNGVRAIRARGPINPSGFITNNPGTGFWTTNAAMQSWGNQSNIEIVCRNSWKQLRCPVQSITGTNILMQQPGWTNSFTSPIPGRPWNGNGHRSLISVTWVENAYELLASPGMWYLNQATGYLYYIPRPGENLTNGTVVVLPVMEKLIDAQGGDITTPLHNVIWSGVTFEYATWLFPSTSYGYADNQTSIMWVGPTNAMKTLGNVSFQTVENVQVTNCVFLHMGGSALDFGGGAHSNIVVGNYIDDISGDGISLGEVIDYAATDPNQMTDSNLIQDNFIRRPGQEYEDCIGIWLGYSENSVITHNDVDNTPYSGICLGWGWGTATYSHNNQLLGNYVGKVMQTLSDGGSVYSLSAQTNSWHIANYYKDSGYQGIYWDEGSQWWMAVSNVFDNVAHNYINLNSSSTNTTGGVLNNQNNTATNNFSNTTAVSALSRGINDVITNTVFSTRQFWPPAAQAIILQAGLEPAFAQLKSPEFLVNDTEVNLDHAPATWTYSAARGYGDYHGDVHYATTDGDYLQYTFTAPAISWIGEMNLDMSNVDVYLDGTFQQTVNCFSSTRVTQARLFTVTNLPAGPHTLKLLKNGGTYMMLDAFAVTPTNFWLTVTTNNVTVSAGGTFSNMVKLDVFGGYVGTTALSASGLPSGASAIFSSPSLNGAGFSVMTVTTTTNTPAGNYEFNVVGIAGGVTNIATIGLTVIGSANLRWNSTTSGAWDLTTSNWFNLGTGLPDVFQTGDNVSFDDTAGVMTNITIAGGATVQPGVVNMTANNNNFTITGAGAIGGAASVVKSGNGLFVLGTTNSFTGGVTISGGILRAGTASALGASSGTTIITNGGTLDVNGFNLTAEPIVVSGVGFNTNGAIINSGASQISALRQVTLAGDVTFGGTNRWDIRNTGGTANLSTSPAGRAYKITKVGTNQVSLVAVSVIEPALGDIDIQQGEFAIQTSTSQVGDPNKTITVYSGAILDVWNLTNTPLNKKIMMNDGSTFFNESGISQIVSPVTLMGNGTFNVVGTSLAFSNVISGAGNLIKSGGSSLILAGTNNYTGNTFVNSGVLALAASGSISNSAVITIASGATVDVTSHSGSPFSLNAGQTLAGGGTINGSLTVNSNAVIAPGNTNLGVLTINTSANLKGTAAMKLNKTARTNDVILISGGGTFTYFGGCSLVVTNLSGTLTTTDSFRLFNALVYGTSPANALPKIVPAIPALNLAWNTNTLAIDGTLRIANSPTPPPRFAAMSASGYNFILTATNGPAGYPVKVLTSTNVSLALANWTVIATNAFDVNGNFSMTNSPGAGLQKFYALQVP